MDELYELPEGWEWKKIDDTIVKTKNITPKNDPQSNFTYIDISSINNNTFSIVSPKTILGKDAPSRAKKEVQVNDIVFATTRPNLKNIAIVKEDYSNPVASTGFCILRTKNKENKYLFFYLLSNIFYKQVEKYIRGAQYPAISDRDVKSISIPLPPLQEQKRIVAKLDSLFSKIDQAIALHQQNIDEAEEFMGSVLNEVFGELEGKYEKKPLGELTKTTSGGTPRRNEKSYWGGTIGWLKSGELNNGYVTEVQEFITEEGLQKSSAKLFPKGTLLIAMYGATVGKLAILDIETTTNQAICGVLNDKQLFETKYMFYFFQKSKEKMLLDSTGGAQPNISQTYLKELQVIYPPLSVQQKTVTYLDQLSQKTEKLKQAQQDKMQSLKDLKASLLDRAFRGEI